MSVNHETEGSWSTEETRLLLKVWGRPDVQEMLVTMTKLDTFSRISDLIQDVKADFRHSSLQCWIRIKHLKQEYRRAKEGDNPASFMFFQLMDRIMAQQAVLAEKQVKKKVKKEVGSPNSSSESIFTEIKIEIDNAEDYRHAQNGYSMEHSSDSLVAGRSHNLKSLCSVSEDPGDNRDDTDVQSFPQDSQVSESVHQEEEICSAQNASPLSDSENGARVSAQEVALQDVCESEQDPCADGKNKPTSPVTVSSAVDDQQSQVNSSPPHFVISSVCHVVRGKSPECDEEGSATRGEAMPQDGDSTAGRGKESMATELSKPAQSVLHTSSVCDSESSDANSSVDKQTVQVDSTSQIQGKDVQKRGVHIVHGNVRIENQVKKNLMEFEKWNVTDPWPASGTRLNLSSRPAPDVSVTKIKCRKDGLNPVSLNPPHTGSVNIPPAVISGRSTAAKPSTTSSGWTVQPDKVIFRKHKGIKIMRLDNGSVKMPEAGEVVKRPYRSYESILSSSDHPGGTLVNVSDRPVRPIMPTITVVTSGMSATLKPGVSLLSSAYRVQGVAPPSVTQHHTLSSSSTPAQFSHPARTVSPLTVSTPVRKLLPRPMTVLTASSTESGQTTQQPSPALMFTTLSSINPVPVYRSGLTISYLTPTTTTVTTTSLFHSKDFRKEETKQRKEPFLEIGLPQKRPLGVSGASGGKVQCNAETDRSELSSVQSRLKAVQGALNSRRLSPSSAKKHKLSDATQTAESTSTGTVKASLQPDVESSTGDTHTPKVKHPGDHQSPSPRPPSVTSKLARPPDDNQYTPSSRQNSMSSGTVEPPVVCMTMKEECEFLQQMLSDSQLSQQCRRKLAPMLGEHASNCSTTACCVSPGAPEAEASCSGSAEEVASLTRDETAKPDTETVSSKVKAMMTGGVIMEVSTPVQASIAQEAGASAVVVSECDPSVVSRQGGVARMTDAKTIKEIKGSVTIPVIAKCRIGHFAEAQILQYLGVDMVDESEVLV
ncbi:uncharacterized protein LOC143301077 [Babylonia areolata]|uniref:uncharacterized protein LOC143301077 n=1 Tax=Babylonia areolata TaxID=304850 RepID=UPI003FD1EAA2